MRKSHTTDLGTGLFVLLGFAAFFFLTTQTTSKGLSFAKDAHYDVTAKFDNIGDLKVGSLVSMAGVEIGRVARIDVPDGPALDVGRAARFRAASALPRLQFRVPDRAGLLPLTRYATLQLLGERRTVGYTEASRGCKHRCRHCPSLPPSAASELWPSG